VFQLCLEKQKPICFSCVLARWPWQGGRQSRAGACVHAPGSSSPVFVAIGRSRSPRPRSLLPASCWLHPQPAFCSASTMQFAHHACAALHCTAQHCLPRVGRLGPALVLGLQAVLGGHPRVSLFVLHCMAVIWQMTLMLRGPASWSQKSSRRTKPCRSCSTRSGRRCNGSSAGI
jgi:hypothetical protein